MRVKGSLREASMRSICTYAMSPVAASVVAASACGRRDCLNTFARLSNMLQHLCSKRGCRQLIFQYRDDTAESF